MKPNLTCRIRRKLLVFPCWKIPHFIVRLLGLHSSAQSCKRETNMKSREDNMERIACTSTRHRYIFRGGVLRYVFIQSDLLRRCLDASNSTKKINNYLIDLFRNRHPFCWSSIQIQLIYLTSWCFQFSTRLEKMPNWILGPQVSGWKKSKNIYTKD